MLRLFCALALSALVIDALSLDPHNHGFIADEKLRADPKRREHITGPLPWEVLAPSDVPGLYIIFLLPSFSFLLFFSGQEEGKNFPILIDNFCFQLLGIGATSMERTF
jgi:hypothetical protein